MDGSDTVYLKYYIYTVHAEGTLGDTSSDFKTQVRTPLIQPKKRKKKSTNKNRSL